MNKFKSEKSRKRKERKYPNGLREIINCCVKYKAIQMPSVTGKFTSGITIVYPKNTKLVKPVSSK